MTTRALLLTDLVDSTRLVERLGDARAAEVFAAHDRDTRALLARHRGREIDRTDGFFVLFEHAAEAAEFAVAYHAALVGLPLTARVGIHFGPVALRQNTPADIARGAKPLEVEGLAKPLAARVMALATGGQTLLSAAARHALGDALPAGAELESHGFYRLKGIEDPIEIYELGERTRDAFAPPPDVDKAYRIVRDGDFWRPVREVRHNLPAERDAFVGRTAELHALAGRLDAGARLVTVLGPGGTGKTRFVRRYGWTWLGDWPGGVYFADLSEARSVEGICFALASALGIPLGKDEPSVQLGHALRNRGRCLVILDNFEQVVAHAEGTVGRWLDHAADASLLVTSRERLHLRGEDLFPLEPLPLEMDAIDLFVARARAQRPDFVLSDVNRAAVVEVVRLLDGLPLAIELAAARVRILSPAHLVARLRDRFSVLAGVRGAAARQATLRAAIDWSWDLLAPWEQAAFAQCAVFEGGFALEAAEAVLDLSSWPEAPPAMDVVQALVDKSLLRTWLPERIRYEVQEPYFGMYISIHEYALEKLDAAPHAAKQLALQRHGSYFAAFGTDTAIASLASGGPDQRSMLALDFDNLVAACRRALVRNDGATAATAYRAVWEVLHLHGPLALAVELGRQVLGCGEHIEAPLRATATLILATALLRAGRMEETRSLLTQALAFVQDAGDRRREARVLNSLATLSRMQGRMPEAREALDLALSLARETGDRPFEG
jgi:predicted ATPase/class 3 adenylate cyclase